MGLKHGHVHFEGHCTDHDYGKAIPNAAIISLCVHALLESMPLAEGAELDYHVHTMGQMHIHVKF